MEFPHVRPPVYDPHPGHSSGVRLRPPQSRLVPSAMCAAGLQMRLEALSVIAWPMAAHLDKGIVAADLAVDLRIPLQGKRDSRSKRAEDPVAMSHIFRESPGPNQVQS